MKNTLLRYSVAESQNDDEKLVDRILKSYQLGNATNLGSSESMWLQGPLLNMRQDVHEALLSNDKSVIAQMLRDPSQTNLLHGFEDISRIFQTERVPTLDDEAFATIHYLSLLELARAVGVQRIRHHNQPEPPHPDTEELLLKLDALFGIKINFPNPFPNEWGLPTSRGIVSYRVPAALYQAWRLRQIVQAEAPRVLEIGAGLGRTAFYARQLGITDYTIVDLPISLVAQANFLGRTIGSDKIGLFGESEGDSDCVKLLPPSAFLESSQQYDLVLNVDSLTEMARDTAQAYCDTISRRASTFLSINHEGLSFTVAELMHGKVIQRTPYWMRVGYVEEVSGSLCIGSTTIQPPAVSATPPNGSAFYQKIKKRSGALWRGRS